MWRRSSAPAVTRGLLTLDPLTEVTDDVELSYWEVVEQPTTHDHCDESALTSPYWATVEQIMRCELFYCLLSSILYYYWFYLKLSVLKPNFRYFFR